MLGRTILSFFLCLSLVYAALDLSKHLDPEGYLGVGLDYEFALHKRPWNPNDKGAFNTNRDIVFTSHIILHDKATKLGPGQQAQLALDAYNEMKTEAERYGVSRKKTPFVMTALAFGNEIILASSHKGSSAFMTDFGDSRIKEYLLRCQIAFNEKHSKDMKHKNGECGELMASQVLALLRPDVDIRTITGRVVSIAQPAKTELGIVRPCPDEQDDIWGCREFAEEMNWEVILPGRRLEPYKDALEEIGVKSKKMHSVLSCESPGAPEARRAVAY